MSSNSGNYLTQRRLAGKKISNTPLYRYNGIVHTVGYRLHGTYLDGKGQGSATSCSVDYVQDAGCCGDSGPPYYDANSCDVYNNYFGRFHGAASSDAVPSASFRGYTYAGYVDSQGYGYSSLAVGGAGAIASIDTIIKDCNSCSGSLGSPNSASFINSSSLGYYTMAGIKHKDGTLWTWGNGGNGALGYTALAPTISPVQLGSDSYITVAGGGIGTSAYFAAIKSDGTLWTWGTNANGQLGDGTTTARSSPVQVSGGGTWKYVHCGKNQTCAIKSDGTLFTWGYNANGVLADTTTTSRSSPVQVSGGGTWKMARISEYNGYGIKTDGTLYGWGSNTYNNVGDGTTDQRNSPVQIGSSFSNWKDVQRFGGINGQAHATRETGEAYAWGYYPSGVINPYGYVSTPTIIPYGTEHSSLPHGFYEAAFSVDSPQGGTEGGAASLPAYITTSGNIIAYVNVNSSTVSKFMIYSGGGAVKAYGSGDSNTAAYKPAHIIKYLL